MLTRAQQFDELVTESARRYQRALGRHWDEVEFVVDDIPPTDPAPWEDGPAVARILPGAGAQAHRIVVYRRPVEVLAGDLDDLAPVVDMVLAQQVALLLGVDIEDVDPDLA